MRKLALILIAVVVVTSGCTSLTGDGQPESNDDSAPAQDNGEEPSESTRQIQVCSQIVLDIVQADTGSAVLQQTAGSESAGEINVTWTYQNGERSWTTTEMTDRRGSAMAETSAAGSQLSKVEAEPVGCEDSGTTVYRP